MPVESEGFHADVRRLLAERELVTRAASMVAGLYPGAIDGYLAKGMYPQRATIPKLADVLGAPTELAAAWLEQAGAARGARTRTAATLGWAGRKAPRGERITLHCRGCGVEVGPMQPAQAEGYRSYEETPAGPTFLCRSCTRRSAPTTSMMVRCRRCGSERQLYPSELAITETARLEDGRQTYLCRRCQARDRAPKATRAAAAKGGAELGNAREVREALTDQLERGIKKIGGRAKLMAMAHAARSQGISAAASERLSIGRFISKPRTGQFRLCPQCRRLIYLTPRQVKEERKGFHRACWLAWCGGDEFRAWKREMGDPRDKARWARLRRKHQPPTPATPEGRPPNSDVLDSRFRWLLRHYLKRESWADIARDESYTRGAISNGVRAFITVLPDSWSAVFGSSAAGARLDDLLPLERLRTREGAEG